jgi:hypothetical protein
MRRLARILHAYCSVSPRKPYIILTNSFVRLSVRRPLVRMCSEMCRSWQADPPRLLASVSFSLLCAWSGRSRWSLQKSVSAAVADLRRRRRIMTAEESLTKCDRKLTRFFMLLLFSLSLSAFPASLLFRPRQACCTSENGCTLTPRC